MLKGLYNFTILLFVALVLVGCSRKRSTFLTRNYHAVTAEYNALYNGQNALDDGMEQRALSYRDDYWEVLPIERFKQEEILRRGKPGNQPDDPNFERAEEKAAKAIQKHSIYVNGKEHNPQIDEAYMMLGKARYYEKRFVPALDAFNFILNRYPTSNNITQAKVWKAKSNIRLNNEEVALEDLLEALEEVEDGAIEMEEDDFADVNAIVAQAYINLDTLEAALPYMKVASETVKNNELKGRYAFIKGQLYNRLGFKDSANIAFDEVIELNRKSPRIYMINAYIEKARNFDYDSGDQVAFLELLRELEENRENRPYLDRIYNQMGDYYRNTADIDSAKIFYNKSIQKFNEDRTLQSVNYSTLAEINFDAAEYKTAGAYYDSTLTFLEENTRRWRRVTKKRENLDDVIKYEDIATLNDSILKFAAMSEAEQRAYFTDYTNKLRAKAIEDSLAQVKKEEEIANKEFFQKSKSSGPSGGGGKFYFYSSTTIAYGKQEFKTRWGARENEDWWRLSSKAADVKGDVVEAEEAEIASQQELFDPQFYIDQIPTDQKVIDSLTKDRDFAYYQLGSIYQVKFKENQLAADRLETLLSYNPEERLVLPSKYNLYKIYVEMENESLATKYKNDIISNHPDSRYAEILLNPETLLSTDESSPEYRYTELYKEFEAQQYQKVIDQSDDYITRYNGDAIVPKFELLKVTAMARQQGFDAYKKGLNYVALTYPNSEAGKEAQEIYATVLPTLENSAFVTDEEAVKWKTIYPFAAADREKAEALATKLKEAVAQYNYYNMSVSVDYYTPETIFVVLHGLNTKGGARNVAEGFAENKDFKIKDEHFQIASANYKIVQIHKNLNDYLNSDSTLENETNPQK